MKMSGDEIQNTKIQILSQDCFCSVHTFNSVNLRLLQRCHHDDVLAILGSSSLVSVLWWCVRMVHHCWRRGWPQHSLSKLCWWECPQLIVIFLPFPRFWSVLCHVPVLWCFRQSYSWTPSYLCPGRVLLRLWCLSLWKVTSTIKSNILIIS